MSVLNVKTWINSDGSQEVHLVVAVYGADVIVRLRSAEAIDELVAALESHRDEVFGGGA